MLRRILVLFFLQALSALMWAHQPLKFLAELKGRNDAASKIYDAYCKTCHDPKPQIPIGAPRINDTNEWAGRLKDRKKLLQHTFEGYQLMPARGGCFECSDEQLVQVIEFMTKTKVN